MSLPDTLLVTFQTQLSAVMESVAKAAMLEVSRLVEDVFVAEVRRSRQEADGLRLQLRRKQEAERSGELMDCGAHRSPDPAGAGHMQNDIVDNADANECKTGLPKNPAATQSEDKDVMPAVELKREEIKKSPCSSLHLKDWHSSPDCEPGQENAGELVDAQPAPAQGNGEELLRNVIKKDPQTSAACGFHENLDKTDMAAFQTSVLSFELSSKWADPPATTAGLLQNHRLGTEPEFDPAPAKGSGSYLEHKLPGPARADVQFASVIDRLSFSESPEARSQPNNMLSRTIKEELIVDSDGFRESGCKDNKTSKAAMQSLTCLLQEEKAKSDAHKPNRVYHRSSTVEGEKLHFHRKSVFRLQTAIQHLHRPLKKPPYRLSSMTTAAISDAHSRSVSLHNPHRVSSTPKANPSTPSVQRIHPGDKQTSTSSRIGASWVGSKSQDQPVNRHQSLSTAASLSDSQLYRPPLHCEECDKSFPHPSNLKAHMQIHTGERPFCCPLCGRSFTKLSNLKAHRRVHTGERPYCCLACGKRFTQKCNLKRHQRIHLDI